MTWIIPMLAIVRCSSQPGSNMVLLRAKPRGTVAAYGSRAMMIQALYAG